MDHLLPRSPAPASFEIGMGSQCPIPITDYPAILLAHGGGGRLTQMLVEKMFVPTFLNSTLETLHDGAILEISNGRLAFSTDSYVIHPLFFPGGDIGSLAVHGTVNDLAMCGAHPLAISSAFILEEGLLMQDLWRIVQSMQRAAQNVGVPIVTGDTKVVDHGKGDGVFINTTGIGVIPANVHVAPTRAQPGDMVLLSGAIAEHGIAVMSLREGLVFETTIQSDSAPLHHIVGQVLEVVGKHVHVLRDPTRGGLASTLNEIAATAHIGIRLSETQIPIDDQVRGACEILGLDPLYVANEGKFLAIVARDAAEQALGIMHAHPLGSRAAIIGEVVADFPNQVYLQSRVGGLRLVNVLSGEQLPRIC